MIDNGNRLVKKFPYMMMGICGVFLVTSPVLIGINLKALDESILSQNASLHRFDHLFRIVRFIVPMYSWFAIVTGLCLISVAIVAGRSCRLRT